MAVTVDGELPPGVTAKDVILALIAKIGTGGGQGHIVEYRGGGDRGAVDGGPHDDLQHVDRGGRPGRHGRPGRDDVRLPQGPPARAAGRRLGRRAGALADAADRRRTRRSTARSCSTRPRSTPFVTWGTNPGQGVPLSGRGARPGRRWPTPNQRARGRVGAGVHGPEGRARRCGTSRWTRCSSAPAPTAGSRTCAPRPRCCTGRKVADGVRMLVVPGLDAGEGAGRGGGAATRSSSPPAPSGGRPAARCALA